MGKVHSDTYSQADGISKILKRFCSLNTVLVLINFELRNATPKKTGNFSQAQNLVRGYGLIPNAYYILSIVEHFM